MKDIVVRIPPSPTGLLHVGTARTALYNYLFAKKHGGKIILRMEDTDKERSQKEYEMDITEGLQKLGLSWDGAVIRQSERTEMYKKHLQKLLEEGKAYHCFCTAQELDALREKAQNEKRAFRYPETCRNISEEEVENRLKNGEKSVIRFRIPAEAHDIVFQDLVRGEVKISAKELDDFVIAKNLETPLYNFCVVVDDAEMEISHVIRGEDHISNTPKQILLFEAFGWEIPFYAHLPLILNADKSKLSKRKNKVSVDDYLNEGFLPEALINFLALVGWNTADEKEIFSLDELVQEFSLERVHKGGAVFDLEKLLWLNGQYIRQKSLEEFEEVILNHYYPNRLLKKDLRKAPEAKYVEADEIGSGAFIKKAYTNDPMFFQKALSLVQERTKKLSEVPEFIRFFFVEESALLYSPEIFVHKKMGTNVENVQDSLQFSLQCLEEYVGEWSIESLKTFFIDRVGLAELKNGFVLYPLRVALSGEEFSPGTFELLEIFGKERSMSRIKRGIEILK
ncbi:MAG: glutamate--tRNA ligase [Candidatus Peregrinibacteria bacterium]